jgi:transposase
MLPDGRLIGRRRLACVRFRGHREKVFAEAGGGLWGGGVSVAQAARDLEIHENMLRRWAKELSADPMQAFPGHAQEKPERLEIERLRKENAKLRAERDILKKVAAFFARETR